MIDTTYWGRNFGVVVFKDWRTKRVLWRKFVRYETLADYQEGFDWLESHNFKIEGVVCDGLRGMFQMLSLYRVQMCQYHRDNFANAKSLLSIFLLQQNCLLLMKFSFVCGRE